MTRIVEKDGTEIIGRVIQSKLSPLPYLRIRRWESPVEPVFFASGFKQSRTVGFVTDIVFVDDILTMDNDYHG